MKAVSPVRDVERAQAITELLREMNTSPIYADLWRFMLNTGLRVGDALKLTYATFEGVKEGYVDLIEQKTKKTKRLQLNEGALSVIEQRRKANPTHTYLFEVDSNRAKGKAISRVTVSCKIKEAGERLNMHLSSHSARKTLGYRVAKEQDLQTAMALLNHSNISSTLKYLGLDDDHQKAVMKKMVF